VLVTTHVHRVERVGTRNTGPAQLHWIDVRRELTVRSHADQAPNAAHGWAAAPVLGSDTNPQCLAFPLSLPPTTPRFSGLECGRNVQLVGLVRAKKPPVAVALGGHVDLAGTGLGVDHALGARHRVVEPMWSARPAAA